MTCDEIFDVLTSGGSQENPAVAGHLKRCARCRDLQDALSPLGAMLTQNAPGGDAISLAGAASEDIVQAAQRSAGRLKQSSPDRTRPPHRWNWRYAAAFLAGVAASVGVAAAVRPEPSPSPGGASAVCLWATRDTGDAPSGDVILTCVACHLTSPHAQ